MKKRKIILFNLVFLTILLILITSPLILAQEVDPPPNQLEAASSNPEANPPSSESEIDPDDPLGITKDGPQEGTKFNIGNIKDKTKEINQNLDKKLEKEVPLPEFLQPIAKFLFGIPEESTIKLFIIALMIWIIFLIVFIDIMRMFSPFTSSTSITIGILLAVMIALTKVNTNMASMLIDFTDKNQWGIAGFIGIVAIAVILAIIIRKIKKPFMRRKGIEKAEKVGDDVGEILSFWQRLKNKLAGIGSVKRTSLGGPKRDSSIIRRKRSSSMDQYRYSHKK